MASVLAIVSKAVFEKEAKGLGEGDVWPTRAYASQNKVLDAMGEGGDLYLVTIRPGEVMWLVGVLRGPTKSKAGWVAEPNVEPIRDVTATRTTLVFAGGQPLPVKVGALAMSLQTPRVLAESDITLLRSSVFGLRSSVRARTKPSSKATKPSKKATHASSERAPSVQPLAEDRRPKTEDLLSSLLALWAREPSVKLAALIDTASAAARTDPPGLNGKHADAKDAWRMLAEDHRPEHVPALLASLTDVSSGDARDRLAMIEGWPLDPRVDAALAGWLDTPPYHATMTKPFYTVLFKLLARVRDPRAAATIAGADAKIARSIAVTMGDWLRAQIAKRLPELQAHVLPDTTPNADVLAGGVAAVRADTSTTDDLLAAVYADPDSDAPRLVYADALQERGDARGELISIQIRRAANPDDAALAAREKELLKLHAGAWLGELKPVLAANPTFERGFLAACRIANRKEEQAVALAGRPEWSTVHTLHGPLGLASRLPRLRTFGYELAWGDGDAAKLVAVCDQLPELRALELAGGLESAAVVLAAPLIARLDRLALRLDNVRPKGLLDVLAPVLKNATVPRLELSITHSSYHPTDLVLARRDAKGKRAYATAQMTVGPTAAKTNWSQALVEEAIQIVRGIPSLRDVTIHQRKALDRTFHGRLAAALKAMDLDSWSVL